MIQCIAVTSQAAVLTHEHKLFTTTVWHTDDVYHYTYQLAPSIETFRIPNLQNAFNYREDSKYDGKQFIFFDTHNQPVWQNIEVNSNPIKTYAPIPEPSSFWYTILGTLLCFRKRR